MEVRFWLPESGVGALREGRLKIPTPSYKTIKFWGSNAQHKNYS